jgi:hypothetical protein
VLANGARVFGGGQNQSNELQRLPQTYHHNTQRVQPVQTQSHRKARFAVPQSSAIKPPRITLGPVGGGLSRHRLDAAGRGEGGGAAAAEDVGVEVEREVVDEAGVGVDGGLGVEGAGLFCLEVETETEEEGAGVEAEAEAEAEAAAGRGVAGALRSRALTCLQSMICSRLTSHSTPLHW